MQCLRPLHLKDGNIVPCGTCPRCRKNRQREWTFRLSAERDAADFTLWLTLTIAPEFMDMEGEDMVLSREKPRHFFEALRKHFGKQVDFKHFLASEYGDQTNRPHFHCLLFGYLKESHTLGDLLRYKNKVLDYICSEGSTAWPYGHVMSKPCHKNVFPYITNYINKPELIDKEHPHKVRPFTCISQGIGSAFMERFDPAQFNDADFTISYNGSKQVLPRYYRDKFFPHSLHELEIAVTSGNNDRVALIASNRERFISRTFEQSSSSCKKQMAKEDRFNKSHSIEYSEYQRGVAAAEERQYNQMLLKRKSL